MSFALASRARHLLAARLGYAFRHARSTLSDDPALVHVCDALKALGHDLAPVRDDPPASNLLRARPVVQDIGSFLVSLASRPSTSTATSPPTTIQTTSVAVQTLPDDTLDQLLSAAHERHLSLVRTVQQLAAALRKLASEDRPRVVSASTQTLQDAPGAPPSVAYEMLCAHVEYTLSNDFVSFETLSMDVLIETVQRRAGVLSPPQLMAVKECATKWVVARAHAELDPQPPRAHREEPTLTRRERKARAEHDRQQLYSHFYHEDQNYSNYSYCSEDDESFEDSYANSCAFPREFHSDRYTGGFY